MKKILLPIALFLCSITLAAQTKIAVLPFSNLGGDFALNEWCYKLQDSLSKAFQELDPDGKYYSIISADSVNNVLKQLNITADSPLFDSEKWNALSKLQVDKVISGTFRITAKRYLINAYIYYPETQLSDPDFQAKDIFKKEDRILEAVSIIVKRLSEAFIK